MFEFKISEVQGYLQIRKNIKWPLNLSGLRAFMELI